jgi:hypothetical protein
MQMFVQLECKAKNASACLRVALDSRNAEIQLRIPLWLVMLAFEQTVAGAINCESSLSDKLNCDSFVARAAMSDGERLARCQRFTVV